MRRGFKRTTSDGYRVKKKIKNKIWEIKEERKEGRALKRSHNNSTSNRYKLKEIKFGRDHTESRLDEMR
jgi:hypothetical protein